MQEIIAGWEIPDVEVLEPDLAPLCEEPEPADRDVATMDYDLYTALLDSTKT